MSAGYVDNECRCCGSDKQVRRAGVMDSDGTYYAFLCDPCADGIATEIARHGRHANADVAEALVSIMPGEFADGVVSELQDLGIDTA